MENRRVFSKTANIHLCSLTFDACCGIIFYDTDAGKIHVCKPSIIGADIEYETKTIL